MTRDEIITRIKEEENSKEDKMKVKQRKRKCDTQGRHLTLYDMSSNTFVHIATEPSPPQKKVEDEERR